MQYPITNDFLKVSIDNHSEPQFVSKLLLQVSAQKLHNSMVSTPEEGLLKEAIDVDNNIIISDSALCKILPPQINKMTSRYKVKCGCE